MSDSSQLTTVYLVGSLGRAPGVEREVWHLDVRSVGEAIRAIDINTGGALSRYLRGPGAKRHYRVALQKKTNLIDPKEELNHRSGRSTIYIMPTIKGRNSGTGKIVAGVVLTALAVVSQQYELLPYTWSFVGTSAYAYAGAIALSIGTSLILGGITQLMTPKALGPGEDQEQKQSTNFQGNIAAVVQGTPVPVVYGRALVSPIPISVTIDNDDLSLTNAGTNGTVEETDLEGGGVQYS